MLMTHWLRALNNERPSRIWDDNRRLARRTPFAPFVGTFLAAQLAPAYARTHAQQRSHHWRARQRLG
jgi:hypothetical protein